MRASIDKLFTLAKTILARGGRFEEYVRVARVHIRADYQRLYRILTNLRGNAVKYNDARGWVELSIKLLADGVQIILRNSGSGLDISQIQTAMALFGTIDQEQRVVEQQTGFGLSVV